LSIATAPAHTHTHSVLLFCGEFAGDLAGFGCVVRAARMLDERGTSDAP
jgi:hypothetical protein